MDKSKIRKEIFKYRKMLDEKEVLKNSELIFNKIKENMLYKEADTVFLYASYNNEVDTRSITEYSLSVGKKVCCPKVTKDSVMEFYEIESLNDLKPGYKGIPEPRDGLKMINVIEKNTIIIIPMVAFDEKRSRIGYGKGFYDRYLCRYKFDKIIGVAFEGQKIEDIEVGPFDISPEIIYTECNVY